MWENLANFCMSEERKILCHLKSWNKPFHIHVYHTINSCIPVLKQCLSLVTKDVFVGKKMCGYWNINTWTVLVKLCCSAGTMYPQKKVIAVYIWLQNAGFLVGKMSPNLVYELWFYTCKKLWATGKSTSTLKFPAASQYVRAPSPDQ